MALVLPHASLTGAIGCPSSSNILMCMKVACPGAPPSPSSSWLVRWFMKVGAWIAVCSCANQHHSIAFSSHLTSMRIEINAAGSPTAAADCCRGLCHRGMGPYQPCHTHCKRHQHTARVATQGRAPPGCARPYDSCLAMLRAWACTGPRASSGCTSRLA